MMSSQDKSQLPPFECMEQAYAWLDSHINHEKRLNRVRAGDDSFKLDSIRRLLKALGDPHRDLKTLHIAGTRGKGSSALMLEHALRHFGYTTATFTSPHIREYRERIRIDGEPICPTKMTELLGCIASVSDKRASADSSFKTVFEILTAAYFLAAQEANVDFAIVETGLGGRLDCTNVLPPGGVLLTRIGLEHTAILGETCEAIAEEKAAILKAGGWGVLNRQSTRSIEAVFRRRSEDVGAELIDAPDETPCLQAFHGHDGTSLRFEWHGTPIEFDLPLYGGYLAENLEGILSVLVKFHSRGLIRSLEFSGLNEAFQRLQLPGRFQPLAVSGSKAGGLFVDGAHCPTSAAAVSKTLRLHFGKERATAVVGMMSDKDMRGFFGAMSAVSNWRRILCYPMTQLPRGATAAEVAQAARRYFSDVRVCPDLYSALRLALEEADEHEMIVALGSIFSVGAVSDWSRQNGGT